MSDQRTVDSAVELAVNRELLKYAAGRAVCCPGCGNVMDWRTTTVLTLHQGERCAASEVLCGACHIRRNRRQFWGEVMAKLEQRMRSRNPDVDPKLSIEVVVGPDVRENKPRSKKGTK